MQTRLIQLSQKLIPLVNQLVIVLQWFARQLWRVWVWLNSLNIPLSIIQWIILLYVIFGFLYAWTTPVFEAEDELWHFGFVQYLRETGELPVQEFNGKDTIYQQHGSQPPLYYLLASIISSPFSIDDVDEYRELNPHVTINQPDSYGNKNLVLHGIDESKLEGTALVVLILRLSGVALGVVTILAIYSIGHYVAPQRPIVPIVAAAITAFNPMFIFISASVNNDGLSMALNAVLIWLLLRVLRDGFNLRFSLLISVLLALTCITKLTSIVLVPVVLFVGFWVYRKTKNRNEFVVYMTSTIILFVALAGWWYVRNLQLYSEPFGMFTMANIAGPRDITFNLGTLLGEYQQFRMSYWGLFGVMNIQISPLFYMLLDLMCFFSLLGLIFLILQLLAIRDFAYARYELTNITLVLVIALLAWAGALYWATLTHASKGQVLFPLMGAISPIIAVGIVEVVWWITFSLRPPNLDFVRAGDAVPASLLQETMLWLPRFVAAVAFLVPFTVIATQYGAPTPREDVPVGIEPVYAEYGDVALLGYSRVDRRYAPGEDVAVTLYWKVLQQSEQDDSILLSLVDNHGDEIGHYVTYPGAGALRTSTWEEGKVYEDNYVLSLSPAAYGRYPLGLKVGWENLPAEEIYIATDAEEHVIAPVILKVGAVVSLRVPFSAQGLVQVPPEEQPFFNESIRLREYTVDQAQNELILLWQSDASPDENYTVFVHALDEDGNIVAQADAPPELPTQYWRWGESYLTYHKFDPDVDLFDYTIIVGWYLNDGFSYPRLEYGLSEDERFDFYELSMESIIEHLEMTEEATSEVTAEVTDEANRPVEDDKDDPIDLETPEAIKPISGTGEATEEAEN